MKLNEKLIKLRKENGLSQEEFGNEINVSRQAVSKWENEETKPDIDKIQEIGKRFNVSFDYLLNDEIEELKPSENNSKPKKSHKRIALKILLVLFIIYFLICLYKFIGLYRFYLIANSFSEENYWMISNNNYSNNFGTNDSWSFCTKKVENILLKETYNFEEPEPLVDSEGYTIPYHIEYTDFDKNICYELIYSENEKKYLYIDNAETDYKNYNSYNYIKENTLDYIPSNFKDRLLMSINPQWLVSIFNREITFFDIMHNSKAKINLNNDYLIENLNTKFEYEGQMSITFSYDYVPGHFKENRITDPLEKYKDMIIYE